MSEHVAFMGLTVDHLYPDCPSLVRARKNDERAGRQCRGTVDPEGSDLCGLCQHRWRRRAASVLASSEPPEEADLK